MWSRAKSPPPPLSPEETQLLGGTEKVTAVQAGNEGEVNSTDVETISFGHSLGTGVGGGLGTGRGITIPANLTSEQQQTEHAVSASRKSLQIKKSV